jgi:imidazoleglycerol phosphate synthase glutamine amidotransferase subunit HisH
VFGRLNIIHVYGDLGGLSEVDYGNLEKATEAAKRINPIRPEAPTTQEEVSKRLTNADNVCFIGFGFAPENMRLFKKIDFKKKRVIATSLGLPRNTITTA